MDLFEPSLRLAEQSSMWMRGYAVLVLLTGVCFGLVYRQSSAHCVDSAPPAGGRIAADDPPTWRQRLHWIVLALVPSSLLLGVTTFITTDVAAVPLLWVVPLVLYLLTFVLVFARRTLIQPAAAARALPIWMLPLAWLIAFKSSFPAIIQAPVHLVAFFLAALVCHGELARRRPDSRHLTDLVVACALCPPRSLQRPAARPLDLVIPVALGLLTFGMMVVLNARETAGAMTVLLVFVVPSLVCFSFVARPLRFALSVGALIVAEAAMWRPRSRSPTAAAVSSASTESSTRRRAICDTWSTEASSMEPSTWMRLADASRRSTIAGAARWVSCLRAWPAARRVASV